MNRVAVTYPSGIQHVFKSGREADRALGSNGVHKAMKAARRIRGCKVMVTDSAPTATAPPAPPTIFRVATFKRGKLTRLPMPADAPITDREIQMIFRAVKSDHPLEAFAAMKWAERVMRQYLLLREVLDGFAFITIIDGEAVKVSQPAPSGTETIVKGK